VLKDGAVASTGEYLTCTGKRPIRIKFSRQYSRLRIYCGTQDADAAATPITVTFGTGFTPNDASSSTTFSLTPKDGNAYVYGSWKEGTKLTVEPSNLDPSSLDLITHVNMVNENIKLESVAGKAYAVEPSNVWVVYNLDKLNAQPDWDYVTNGKHIKLKLIGTWPSFDLSFSGTGYLTDVDLSAVKDLELITAEFSDCTSLKSVILSEGLKTIPMTCFQYCDKLSDISIPSSVTKIAECAFKYCESLTSITLPSYVASIGDHAFYHCSQLTKVICEATYLPTLGDEAFKDCSDDIKLYVPDASLYGMSSSWFGAFGQNIYKIEN
jgi:hypothetical protein